MDTAVDEIDMAQDIVNLAKYNISVDLKELKSPLVIAVDNLAQTEHQKRVLLLYFQPHCEKWFVKI